MTEYSYIALSDIFFILFDFWGNGRGRVFLFVCYIQSFHMTEYFSPERALSVRVYVCLSVTAFYLNTIWPILIKLGPHDLNKNLR